MKPCALKNVAPRKLGQPRVGTAAWPHSENSSVGRDRVRLASISLSAYHASSSKRKPWEDFVRSFAERCSDPQHFKEACRAADGGRELKRVTDKESHTPFSPYNLWLYRQTYFGIRDLLRPLVHDGLVSVLRMQNQATRQTVAPRDLPGIYLETPTVRPDGSKFVLQRQEREASRGPGAYP